MLRRTQQKTAPAARDQPRAWADRGRAFKLLTFWLRPVFALRVVNRFQAITGFDRAVALASSGLTALVPLGIVTGTVIAKLGGADVGERLIDRYDLSAAGADAVREMFSPAGEGSTSIGLVGAAFFVLTVLSFTRAVQRLFEQTWELPPLSVRNSLNGLRWAAGFVAFIGVSTAVHATIGDRRLDVVASLLVAPVAGLFFLWSGRVLSANRIPWHDLRPFAIVAAVLEAVYGMGASVYLPHMFSTYAGRYGTIGAVLALISALFCIMVILVGAAALGREVSDELGRIRRGERPHEDEVRREWDDLIADLRSRFDALRERRRKTPGDEAPRDDG